MKFGIREIVFLALLVAIPVSAWCLAFRPDKIRNERTLKRIKVQRAKLADLNHATATIGDMQAQIHQLKGAIGYFSAKLPSQKDMDQVLRELWRLAEANNLTTKSIRPLYQKNASRLTDPNGPYAEQPISMTLEGSFKGFYGFLLAMERQPRIMRLLDVTVQKMQGQQDRVRTTCLMSIFFERTSED